MRLIDADALIKFLDVGHLRHPSELCFSELDVANMLNHAPTAYDVEKVEKENEALKNRCRVLTNGTMCFFCPSECKNRTAEFRGDIGGRE